MKVTFNWLRQYIEFHWTAEELAERLTMLGVEVENVQKIGGEFEGIVVAQILTRSLVSGSDKLSVCRVQDGKGERQIICGASNFKPGDKAALILPGYALPLKAGEKEPFVIKVRKVMGVESHGMLCSPKELGLAEEAEGILILRDDARVGQSFAEYLGRAAGDVVYDLEITPNRPDLNSVIGIAREISALTGNPLRMPEVTVKQDAGAPEGAQASALRVEDLVAVRIEDTELCPRYTARIVRGVALGPSPDWLRNALEKIGIRSINNVVDVTNFVMMEIGQPLHAFDYRLLANVGQASPLSQSGGSTLATMVIRRAAEGEKFTTLDGQERTLTSEMLLIADETRGIALAGIMGGRNTEINAETRDVLIESAHFKPTNIRRTSKALGLRSESSYRFERGADLAICDWASRRAAQLILETAGGALAAGVVDAFSKPPEAKQIALRHTRSAALLGVDIPADQQTEYLHRLGLEVTTQPGIAPTTGVRTPHSTIFRIPSFRVDLKREIDLIEEIGRLYGADKIPSTPPRAAIGSNAYDAVHDEIAEARKCLTGLGLHEAEGQTLISDLALRALFREREDRPLIALENPLSSDMNVLRPSLLPGLLDSLRHNLSRKNERVALFEIGRVFVEANGQAQEGRRLAFAVTGPRYPLFWSGNDRRASFDIYDLKGMLEEFLEQFGLRGVSFAVQPECRGPYLESAAVLLGGKLPLGEFGQLLPAIAKQYDLRDAVLMGEWDFDALLARRNKARSFKPLPAFPSIRRDIAMFVTERTTHEAVLNAIKQAKPQALEQVELFDVFRGQNVPAGQKSVAYALTYRQAERTLTDAEVNTIHEKVIAHLKQALQAAVRE
ncbi:MAG: phenylalanine--tRNA ligase subunit beta [Verrucomicrobia bacterium]|nr:phenylalanine--tRNA ligase subunit beta [Verrucomicrobiota bacterium]